MHRANEKTVLQQLRTAGKLWLPLDAAFGTWDGACDRNPFGLFLREVARALRTQTRPLKSGFRKKVERYVESLLASGAVRIDDVARAFGCSRQTLYRRLKEEGATFAVLVDGVRRRLALRLLRDEGVSVKEVAYRLGFSDPAAFSRAFKRWTGASPSAARGV